MGKDGAGWKMHSIDRNARPYLLVQHSGRSIAGKTDNIIGEWRLSARGSAIFINSDLQIISRGSNLPIHATFSPVGWQCHSHTILSSMLLSYQRIYLVVGMLVRYIRWTFYVKFHFNPVLFSRFSLTINHVGRSVVVAIFISLWSVLEICASLHRLCLMVGLPVLGYIQMKIRCMGYQTT